MPLQPRKASEVESPKSIFIYLNTRAMETNVRIHLVRDM